MFRNKIARRLIFICMLFAVNGLWAIAPASRHAAVMIDQEMVLVKQKVAWDSLPNQDRKDLKKHISNLVTAKLNFAKAKETYSRENNSMNYSRRNLRNDELTKIRSELNSLVELLDKSYGNDFSPKRGHPISIFPH